MRTASKIIYFAAIAFIVAYLLLLILFKLLPLEFSDQSFNIDFTEGFLFTLPLAVFLLVFRIGFAQGWIKTHKRYWIFGMLTLAIAFFFILFIYTLAAWGSSLCIWTNDQTLFKNKKSRSIIVVRSFGCGAVDSTPATKSTFKVRRIFPFINYVTRIDTLGIDGNKWERVNNARTLNLP